MYALEWPVTQAAVGIHEAQVGFPNQAPPVCPAGPLPDDQTQAAGFRVQVADFDGPFDLLLSLIQAKKLELTALSLSKVTDDFLAYIVHVDRAQDVGQISEFLVVAATLLDAKAALLLPQPAIDSEEDLAALEARDLLMARLLQYRAVKTVAAQLAQWWEQASLSYPRPSGLQNDFAHVLPAAVAGLTPQNLVRIATRVLTPAPVQEVSLSHLHAPVVNVADQAHLISQRLRQHYRLSFAQLCADAGHQAVVVGRFLALLELFRQRWVSFTQPEPLGELTVRWEGEPDEVIDLRESPLAVLASPTALVEQSA